MSGTLLNRTARRVARLRNKIAAIVREREADDADDSPAAGNGDGPPGEVNWKPSPGPQTMAYESEADELFYGGSAGGGKSSLLVGLALTRHRNSIIFRREYPQLTEIADQIEEVIGKRGKYNQQTHVARMGQRKVTLASMPHPKDVQKYQGRPRDFFGFDEAPQFSLYQFQFVTAWNRSKYPGQRCRIVLAGNPPTTAEGRWIIDEFAPWLDDKFPEPAAPGELRWYLRLPDPKNKARRILHWFRERPDPMPDPEVPTELLQARSRTFIPARLEDNPFLRETGYRSVLQGLPEPLRSQMLYGDMKAGMDDAAYQVIPTAWVRLAMERWKQYGRPVSETGGPVLMDALGVDVARGGKDETTLAPKYGNWFAELECHPGSATPDGPAVALLVVRRLAKEPNADRGPSNIDHRPRVRIDPIGVGTSPLDFMKTYRVRMEPVDARLRTDGRDRTGMLGFKNVRAEMWWRMREALDPDRGDGLMLPPDNQLLADLCAPCYFPIPGGIQIEEKEDIAKRISRSPDRGEAVVMAHYDGVRKRSSGGGIIL